MQNCRRKGPNKIVSMDRRTNGQTDGQPWRFQYTPHNKVEGGIKKGCNCQHCLEVLKEFPSSIMTESGKYATKNTGNKPLH